jgi:undecaprenyl-diphosphatase
MFMDALQTFLSFLQNHLWLAYASIFLIAMSESLALVGLIIPGAVLMFAIGTLITTDYLEFYTTVIWATLGAVSGDGLSYWLGARYKQQLQNLWPLSRYPGILDKGMNFFKAHGGKSVLFGRFVGPLRPIIPAIAGMFGMPRRQFLLINVLSGIAWAPLYLLPGMAFGLSLELAGEVAGKLVIWIVMILISILLVIWLMRHVYSFTLRHTEQWVEQLLHWSHRHPTTGQIPAALLEPLQSETRSLAWLALIFFFTVIVLTVVAESAQAFTIVSELEHLIISLPSFIRTPVADTLFSLFLYLGHPTALSIFALCISLWLAVQKRWLLTLHLLLSWLLPAITIVIMNLVLQKSMSLLANTPGSLLLTSSLYTFVALLFGKEIRQARRPAFYTMIAVILFMILLAQLYWQYIGFVKACIEMLSGIAWATLMSIAYRRHLKHPVTHYKAAIFFVLALFVAWSMRQPVPFNHDEMTASQSVWTLQEWQSELWQQLPRVRADLLQTHHYPFNIQWAGNKKAISQQLASLGWQPSPEVSWRSVIKSLKPSPQDMELPVLPHVHHGQYESWRWIKFKNGRLYVIRLWSSHVRIASSNQRVPLWFGSISIMQQASRLGWHYLLTTQQFEQALAELRSESLNFVDKKELLLID